MPRRNNSPTTPAFTLVELILVMAVLTTIMAIVAPSLSRSFRQRNLDQEAVRFVALTEYARDEAVSQGVPIAVWVDPDHGAFGADAVTDYQGRDVRPKQFTLNQSLHFDAVKSKTMKDSRAQIIQFTADGSPDVTEDSVDSIRIMDQFNASVSVALGEDGWGYEVVKEGSNAPSRN
jgi:type II secretion system protein H